MKIRWRLRMAAAQREVWTGTELRRLLAEKAGLELSSASVSALLTKEPSQIKLSTLIALCTALECTPNDLFEVDTTPVEQPATPSDRCRSRRRRPRTRGAGRCRRCSRESGSGCTRWGNDNVTVRRAGRRLASSAVGCCCRCVQRQRETRRQGGPARTAAAIGCWLPRPVDACCVRGGAPNAVIPSAGPMSTLCKTCRRRADLLARQRRCPRCGKPGYLRAETGWCGSCSRPGPPKDPPRICQECGELRRH